MTTPQQLLHIPELIATLSDLPTDIEALSARLDGRTQTRQHSASAAEATERRWMAIRPVAPLPAPSPPERRLRDHEPGRSLGLKTTPELTTTSSVVPSVVSNGHAGTGTGKGVSAQTVTATTLLDQHTAIA